MTSSTDAPTYAKGTWQDSLQQSSNLLDRSAKARKRASMLLWTGAVTAINAFLPNFDDDASAEGFYNEVLEALGTARKGDASKIKTVALAVAEDGLVLDTFENLSKAYAEATRLRKTVAEERSQDDAAEAAVAAIEAPKSTSSVDGAAALLLSKGIDGAIVAILDAMGKDNFDAHKAFMRAVGTEISSRVQAAKPKPEPKVKAAPKAGAKVAKKTAAPKATAAKAKPKKAAAAPVEEVVEDDVIEESQVEGNEGVTDLDDEETVEEAVVAPVKAKRRATPVRRRG